MGKIVYSWVIRRDSKIPGTVVRSSTIPEQLGRISYLLTDKTGEYLLRGSRSRVGGVPVSSLLPLEVGEVMAAVFPPHYWMKRECLVPVVGHPCGTARVLSKKTNLKEKGFILVPGFR